MINVTWKIFIIHFYYIQWTIIIALSAKFYSVTKFNIESMEENSLLNIFINLGGVFDLSLLIIVNCIYNYNNFYSIVNCFYNTVKS